MSKLLIKKIALFFGVMVIFFLSCAKAGHTKKMEWPSSAISGKNVVVLFRIKTIIIGERSDLSIRKKEIPEKLYFPPSATEHFSIKIKDAQGGQAPKKTHIISPSKEADSYGWAYVTLPPGNYFINITRRYISHKDILPAYAIKVPEDQLIVYIGSFLIYCNSRWHWDLKEPGRTLTDCLRNEMQDETNEALIASKTYFKDYGQLAISLAHRK